jgi:ATP-dependent DNA helicase RecG
MGLNERQINAVLYVVENGSITNSQYQQVCNTSERTALRDLEELIHKEVLVKTGLKKGTSYKLADG